MSVPNRFTAEWWREQYVASQADANHFKAMAIDASNRVTAAHARIDELLQLQIESDAKIGDLIEQVSKLTTRVEQAGKWAAEHTTKCHGDGG